MRLLNPAAVFALLAALSLASANAASMLRVTCEGEAAGAEVSINGSFKGTCPIDIQVPAGVIVIRAAKKTTGNLERAYEREERLGDGIVKKLEVRLGGERLNAQTRSRIAAREASLADQREAQQLKELPGLIKAAESGDAAAMLKVGNVYDWGLAGAVDFKRALHWYERAAQVGLPAAMSALAVYYGMGREVKEDKDHAHALFAIAAEHGDSYAMFRLGDHYDWTVEDQALALSWYQKSAAAGSAEGLEKVLSIQRRRDPGSSVSSELIGLWAARASEGEPFGWAGMGRLQRYLEEGANIAKLEDAEFAAKGKPKGPAPQQPDRELMAKSYSLYVRYMQKAAATGNKDSLLSLASVYKEGRYGVAKDKGAAIKLAREAAKTGDAYAVKFLDEMLAN